MEHGVGPRIPIHAGFGITPEGMTRKTRKVTIFREFSALESSLEVARMAQRTHGWFVRRESVGTYQPRLWTWPVRLGFRGRE
jgi:hypothetical protein